MSSTLDFVSLEALPVAAQRDAWRDALAAFALAIRLSDGDTAPSGQMAVKISSTGARLGLVRSTAQFLQHRRDAGPMLVLFHAYGRGRIEMGARGAEFAEGDISVCDMRESWCIDLNNDFEILMLELPHQRLADRLGHGGVRLPAVLGASVAAAAVRPVMRSLAANFELLAAADLPSAEIAITELIAGALLAEAKPAADGATQVQTAHLRRVFAAIEAQLGTPHLAMADIAEKEALSPRYLQRLFELQGLTFSDYVKRRRLERCRQDLIDPKYADQSIAEIGFRWGFRDQAHFSRVFSNAYGVPPRSLRKAVPDRPDVYPYRGRPPARAGASVQSMPTPNPTLGDATAAHDVVQTGKAADAAEFYLPISKDTVHWGYLSRMIPPALLVPQESVVTIETLTQHAFDDYERMIKGDAGAESVMRWTKDGKAVERRGAGPMNASVFGRGAGEGFGVHICTGPIHIRGAEPGDVVAVEILAINPRSSGNPEFAGRAFGSNAAAWWGYHYHDLIDAPKPREVITIFEVDAGGQYARALYSYRWTPQKDPFGVRHETIDYPGVPVDHTTIDAQHGALTGVRVPLRPHFGFMAVAPKEADIVDSIPPGYFGGNIDNWRAGAGAKIYLPVAVPGALFSVGDPHLTQGDGEINGTALEGSLTGTFRLTLHKKAEQRSFLRGLAAPLIETPEAFVLQGFSYTNYLRELGRNAQTDVYQKSSVDRALRNAFRAARKFLMEHYGLNEDEALALMSLGVDFGITQVADGNWGVHAVIRKGMFAGR